MEFIVLFFSGIFFTIFPVINPDYDAYLGIYSTAELSGDWEILYIYINYIFREAGFTYDQFRFFIFLFSLVGLWLLLSILRPAFKTKNFFSAYSLKKKKDDPDQPARKRHSRRTAGLSLLNDSARPSSKGPVTYSHPSEAST